MTSTAQYVVLGLGPGGQLVAEDMASAGKHVVAVDAGLVGGECPYWGCVPTKMMARAAYALAEARRVDGLAGHAVVAPDWAPVAKRIREEATDHWNDAVAVKRLEGKGARFVRGHARVTSPMTATVDTSEGSVDVEATVALVIAIGSEPAVPPIEGLAGTPYWTNHGFIEAENLPASLVVLGGGAIGCELAQISSRFGVAVTVVEPGARLLGAEEPESSDLLARVFEAEGIGVHTGDGVARVSYDSGFTVTLASGTEVTAEQLLLATGRKVDLRGLGVTSLGADDEARALVIDEQCRVVGAGGSLPHTYAIGDVTGQGAFTHVAVHQGRLVRDLLLGHDTLDRRGQVGVLPRVTFTDPEIGAVGLTEHQAREHYGDVSVATLDLAAAATRGWIHGPGNDGLIKLVAHDGVLVGATSAGPAGGEVLGALSVAVQAGVSVRELQRQIWAYPTLHRGIEYVLTQLA